MNTAELYRLLCNLIRVGVVTEVNHRARRCRVASGELLTDWLPWLTHRAGKTRTWWAPSEGEQVLLLSVGGELTTAFVLPAIYSDEFNAPSSSVDAWHVTFPDGASVEYEPETGALAAKGIKTADIDAQESITATSQQVTVNASVKIMLNTPIVECSTHLITQSLATQTFTVASGGTMAGVVSLVGSFSLNGVKIEKHNHGGVQAGNGQTGGPQ